MPYTSEVFGVSTCMNEYSYVDRDKLDNKLTRLLRRQTHIAIKGPSKSGKSWLRQKCINNTVIVQCRLHMTVNDIYKLALASLGIQFDTSSISTSTFEGSFSGGGSVGFKPLVKATGNTSLMYSHESTIDNGRNISNSIENLQFVANAINSSGKRLTIEDFHYLDLSVRQELAHDLKSLWDFGCFVIIIGVWTQANLLTAMNHDLSGRIEEISVTWADTDLQEVIDRGCSALNIKIDPQICNDLIGDSFGNVGILQALLLRLVEDEANIEDTQSYEQWISNYDLYVRAAKEYANQLDGLYQQFASTLSAGIRRRKNSTGIYALAMQVIVEAKDKELIFGLSRNDIYQIIHDKEPRIFKGNLKTVLIKLAELQQDENENGLVVLYDESIDSVCVVDRQLLFYRKHHTMKWPWEEMAEEARQLSIFDDSITEE